VVAGADDWSPVVYPGANEAALCYTCPTCGRDVHLNMQLEVGKPTETQLWCQQDGVGVDVRIVEVRLTAAQTSAIETRMDSAASNAG
jgi:hypothetical protein